MDLGRLDQAGERWQLAFTRTLPHPPEKVWRALTEPEHLRAWFPMDIEGERAVGAPLRFTFREDEAPAFDGEMLVYDPPAVLEFRWGEDVLRFELEPRADGTVLVLRDTFDELGRAARDAAGWHACLDVLAVELSGEDAPWRPEERWADVHPEYVRVLGPEAAAIGPPGRGS